MQRSILAAIFALSSAAGLSSAPAKAQSYAVECASHHGRYHECASPFFAPVLVRQVSSSPCIINNSWGFDPRSGYIWVAGGCRGIFADHHGYHYGAAGGYDPMARSYDDDGRPIRIGPIVIGPGPIMNPPHHDPNVIGPGPIMNPPRHDPNVVGPGPIMNPPRHDPNVVGPGPIMNPPRHHPNVYNIVPPPAPRLVTGNSRPPFQDQPLENIPQFDKQGNPSFAVE